MCRRITRCGKLLTHTFIIPSFLTCPTPSIMTVIDAGVFFSESVPIFTMGQRKVLLSFSEDAIGNVIGVRAQN